MFQQPFYSQSQFHNNRMPKNVFIPTHSTFHHPTSKPNRSTQNLNFSRDFERFQMPAQAFTTGPKGPYSFYDTTRWRYNMPRIQQQSRPTPAFHFQDKSTFYYMSDPIVTNDNRITIQLTKVHIGANGDQQRVFVEQDFSNKNELKKFVKNCRSNFKKTFHHHQENPNTNKKKPDVIVVEEPDEEPKIYNQNVHDENSHPEQYQRLPFVPSSSTIWSNKRRRNKMKYQRANGNRYYQTPPRFHKENNFNPYGKFYNDQHQSRCSRLKDQQKFQAFHRTGYQPTSITENLVFSNPKQEQIRVDRTRSECRSKIPFRNRNKIPQYVDPRQCYFNPLISSPTPHLLNLYHPHSKHF